MGLRAAAPGGSAPWRLAVFLAFAAALNYADRSALAAVLPSLAADFSLTDVELGYLGSFFLWSYALASPVAGWVGDRLARDRVVAASLVAWSAVTALMAVAPNFHSLLALRAGLGLSECLFLPAAFALIAQHHGVGTRARAMALISVGTNVGMILGGTLSGYLADQRGWRWGFVALGLSGLLLAIASRACLPGERPRVAPPARLSSLAAAGILLRNPTYLVLLAESMLTGTAMWVFYSWLPLYFREVYDMSLAAAGFAGTFMLQISVMLGLAVGGWMSDRAAARQPRRRMLVYSLSYFAAAPFLLLFLGAPPFPVVAAAIGAFSFLRGMGQVNDRPVLCEVVPPPLRATAVGIVNACAAGVGGIGVVVAGYLKAGVGLGAIFAGLSVAFLVAAVILLLAYLFLVQRDITRADHAEG